MVKVYSIYYGHNLVGQARFARQGLYYHIYCDIKRVDNNLYRVYVQCGNDHVDLGICVPEGNRFVINKRIAIKSLNEEPECFHLIADADVKRSIPVLENKPFDYIQELNNSKYLYTENKAYVICPKL